MDLVKVERAFADALALADEARLQFLAELQLQDAATAKHVASLLRSNDDNWLRDPVAKVTRSLSDGSKADR